jgi:hypothetical protein
MSFRRVVCRGFLWGFMVRHGVVFDAIEDPTGLLFANQKKLDTADNSGAIARLSGVITVG